MKNVFKPQKYGLEPPKMKVVGSHGGGFNSVEKYARRIGSSPQVGIKNNKCLKPPS